MSSKRRHKEAFAEHSYWQSYSDMMAALLLIFVLMIAITLAIYKQKTTDLEKTRLDLSAAQVALEKSKAEIEQSNQELALSLSQLQTAYDQAALTEEELKLAYLEIEKSKAELATTKSELQDIVGIRTDIIGSLQSKFNNSSMSVDAQTGSITFSADVLFRYNSATLTKESKQTLKNVIPMYLEVLLQDEYRDYIAEIIIEGHTDTDGGYEGNMDLSHDRANEVAKFCLDEKNGLSKVQIEQLQNLLTINGKSCSNPIYKTDGSGKVDMQASRRVEIKFRLKEDEMIQKISQILEQE